MSFPLADRLCPALLRPYALPAALSITAFFLSALTLNSAPGKTAFRNVQRPRVAYVRPKQSELYTIYSEMRSRHVLERVAAVIGRIRLPKRLTVPRLLRTREGSLLAVTLPRPRTVRASHPGANVPTLGHVYALASVRHGALHGGTALSSSLRRCLGNAGPPFRMI